MFHVKHFEKQQQVFHVKHLDVKLLAVYEGRVGKEGGFG